MLPLHKNLSVARSDHWSFANLAGVLLLLWPCSLSHFLLHAVVCDVGLEGSASDNINHKDRLQVTSWNETQWVSQLWYQLLKSDITEVILLISAQERPSQMPSSTSPASLARFAGFRTATESIHEAPAPSDRQAGPGTNDT